MCADLPVVVSGIRATGRLHLGNYFGAMKNFPPLQDSNRCFFFIADYHTLTTLEDPDDLRRNLPEIVLDYLATGLDPKKSVIFAQSSVPQIAELSLLLGMITQFALLERCPTFKEKKDKHPENINLGLFSYPVLMAADILIQRANLVPVGEDQLPHIELAQYIAKKFNTRFGETFPIPEAMIEKAIRVPGLDGTNKMGKSDDNTINLNDPPETIRERISNAVSDTQRARRSDPGRPYVCNLFALHEFVTDQGLILQIKSDCEGAKIGCVDCKRMLSDSVTAFLAPFQARRAEIARDPSLVASVLGEGGRIARETASETVETVREKMGLVRY